MKDTIIKFSSRTGNIFVGKIKDKVRTYKLDSSQKYGVPDVHRPYDGYLVELLPNHEFNKTEYSEVVEGVEVIRPERIVAFL